MNVKQAWFCPACQRHHAPHVDTCPERHTAAPSGPVLPYQPYVPPPIYTVPAWPPARLDPLPVKSDPNMMLIN